MTVKKESQSSMTEDDEKASLILPTDFDTFISMRTFLLDLKAEIQIVDENTRQNNRILINAKGTTSSLLDWLDKIETDSAARKRFLESKTK